MLPRDPHRWGWLQTAAPAVRAMGAGMAGTEGPETSQVVLVAAVGTEALVVGTPGMVGPVDPAGAFLEGREVAVERVATHREPATGVPGEQVVRARLVSPVDREEPVGTAPAMGTAERVGMAVPAVTMPPPPGEVREAWAVRAAIAASAARGGAEVVAERAETGAPLAR